VAAGIDHEMAPYTSYDRIRAILVIANGRTVFERYYRSTASESHNVASVTKSVISTLVGIAVGEGRLRLDQPLAQLLPSYAATMSPAVAHATLRQVLTMTAGFAGQFNADDVGFATAPDWVRAILTHPARPPGGSFGYSSGGSHLLSAILVTATGTSVLDYARAKLFDPLGIPTRPAFQPPPTASNIDAYQNAGFAWPVDPQQRHAGFGFLKLRPQDMAKIGTLYLNAGAGRAGDPACRRRIEDATTAHATAADGATSATATNGGLAPRRPTRLPGPETRRKTPRSRSPPPPPRRHLHLHRPERPQRPRRHPHGPHRPGRHGHRPGGPPVSSDLDTTTA
jgi:CubicO group peptidase (beta-lactamase class C family)